VAYFGSTQNSKFKVWDGRASCGLQYGQRCVWFCWYSSVLVHSTT